MKLSTRMQMVIAAMGLLAGLEPSLAGRVSGENMVPLMTPAALNEYVVDGRSFSVSQDYPLIQTCNGPRGRFVILSSKREMRTKTPINISGVALGSTEMVGHDVKVSYREAEQNSFRDLEVSLAKVSLPDQSVLEKILPSSYSPLNPRFGEFRVRARAQDGPIVIILDVSNTLGQSRVTINDRSNGDRRSLPLTNCESGLYQF